jgi:hypothetical protein
MAEKVFTDNTTGKIIVGTLTAAMAAAANQKNIANLADGANQVKILASGDTSNAFKISYIRAIVMGGALTGSPVLFIFKAEGTVGKMVARILITQAQTDTQEFDMIFPAGTEIWAGKSLLTAGAGSELNVCLKISEYE